MKQDKGSIFSNALPAVADVPVVPHPYKFLKRATSNLPSKFKNSIATIKGEFGTVGDGAAFSLRITPAVSRLRVESVRPVRIQEFEDGSVVVINKDFDPLFSSRESAVKAERQVIGVNRLSLVLKRDGSLLGEIHANHHVQSVTFQGSYTQAELKGQDAVRLYGSEIIDLIEEFGPQLLDSISDVELKAKAAKALGYARDAIAESIENIGSRWSQPIENSAFVVRKSVFDQALLAAQQAGLGVVSGRISDLGR